MWWPPIGSSSGRAPSEPAEAGRPSSRKHQVSGARTVYSGSVPVATRPQPPQQVKFCLAPDGVRIAYAVHGRGPALLISTCWLSHLQFDWESPVWRHFLTELGEFATVIRFD